MTRQEFLKQAAKQVNFQNNVLIIGWDDQGFFSISDDGRIFTSRGFMPVARTTLEYIYAFGADLDENVKWL
ncbi:MAG: hypothetical protein HDT42_11565 [Ruminococcaceae bacterium]|nr:hypothetical protein [Oscillospiraceae bacterium]